MNNVIVIGDIMLDLWQRVQPFKISAEAPVFVTNLIKEEHSLGGAGNAAVNVSRLCSGDVYLRGYVGNDDESSIIRALGREAGIVMQEEIHPDMRTTVKCRITNLEGVHMLRVDREPNMAYLPCEQHRKLIQPMKGVNTVLISDYGKGVIDEFLLKAVGEWPDAFTVINGKPEHFDWYVKYTPNALLVVNREEALAITSTLRGGSEHLDGTIGHLAQLIWRKFGMAVVVTGGADGLVCADRMGTTTIAAVETKIADVAGAGDVVCATIAAEGKINTTVLEQAVINAGDVVSRHGTCVVEVPE